MLLMHQYTYQMRREEEEETWVLKMERRTEEEEDNCSATLDLHLKFLDNFINLFRTLTHHNYINVNEGLQEIFAQPVASRVERARMKAAAKEVSYTNQASDHMIAETSTRSVNPPEQTVQNTKRKRDTASGGSAIVIYTPDEHYIQKINNAATNVLRVKTITLSVLASTMWKMTMFKMPAWDQLSK
ncbi:hypothetical protein Tco_1564231 [Tanacetum coccineum]